MNAKRHAVAPLVPFSPPWWSSHKSRDSSPASRRVAPRQREKQRQKQLSYEEYREITLAVTMYPLPRTSTSDFHASAPRHAGWIAAPIVRGVVCLVYRRTRIRGVRVRGVVCVASLCEGPAGRRAAQLTPLAARSWLNAPPFEEGAGAGGQYPTWGEDRRRHTRPRPVANTRGTLIGVGALLSGWRRFSGRKKRRWDGKRRDIYQDLKSRFAIKQAIKKSEAFMFFILEASLEFLAYIW